MRFYIKTEVCGNPDYGQHPDFPPYGVDIVFLSADTFEGLLDQVKEWQYQNDIGGGNWQNPALYENEEIVGYMSYNGKIWKEKHWTPTTEQVYFRETV